MPLFYFYYSGKGLLESFHALCQCAHTHTHWHMVVIQFAHHSLLLRANKQLHCCRWVVSALLLSKALSTCRGREECPRFIFPVHFQNWSKDWLFICNRPPSLCLSDVMSMSVLSGLWQPGCRTGNWRNLRWLWLVAAALMSLPADSSARDVSLISPSGTEKPISQMSWFLCPEVSTGNSRHICYLPPPLASDGLFSQSICFLFSAPNCFWNDAVQLSFYWQVVSHRPEWLSNCIVESAVLFRTIPSVETVLLLWFTVAKDKLGSFFLYFSYDSYGRCSMGF